MNPYVNIFSLLLLILFSAWIHAEKRPNVVLIVCDDLNDYITGIPGDRGHKQAISPNIDKFAKTAVSFRRAYTNNPVCGPSRASFLSGIYPHKSGNLFFDKWYENEVLQNSNTIMEHFQNHGYHVAGSGKMMHHYKEGTWDEYPYKADYGPLVYDGEKRTAHPIIPKPFYNIGVIDGSFSPLSTVPYQSDNNPTSGWIYGTWNQIKPFQYKSPSDRDPTPDERNALWAANRIKELSMQESPYFLGIGFVRPHTPLHVAKKYFDKFPLEKVELPEILENDITDTHFKNHVHPLDKGPRYFRDLQESYKKKDEGLKRFVQAYLACVAAVDENIGKVLDAVEKSPERDNTIVIITSDHGWMNGQKDYLFKDAPYEDSLRVPLIIKAPGLSQDPGIAEHPVSLIDIYPTLIDLCNLNTDTRKNYKGATLDGHSLKAFLKDPQNGKWNGPNIALSMVYAGAETMMDPTRQHWSVRSKNWRYILYNDGTEELYNHLNDPREWRNLADKMENQDILSQLRNELQSTRGTMRLMTAQEKDNWDPFKTMDRDRSGGVCIAEWNRWSKNSIHKFKNKDRFQELDKNQNGFLTRQEVKDILH